MKFVERVRKDPFFLAHPLESYKELHGIEDLDLEAFLGCDSNALTRLALCRRPDDRESRFQERVQKIAEYAPCRADKLMSLLREVAAFSSLKEDAAVQTGMGLLMAARDRRRQEEEQKEDAPDKKERHNKSESTSDE
jgi:hypothetical protein